MPRPAIQDFLGSLFELLYVLGTHANLAAVAVELVAEKFESRSAADAALLAVGFPKEAAPHKITPMLGVPMHPSTRSGVFHMVALLARAGRWRSLCRSNMNTSTSQESRLSVLYLLCLTAGVGIAISITRGIERLRFPADAFYYNLDGIQGIDAFAALIAAVYGVCLTTFIFAWRSGDLWGSPGKILALLFATMCVLNWALDLFAALLMNYRMLLPPPAGVPDTRGYIAGIWYGNFAPSLGYVAGLPILALVAFKTRTQKFSWRFVWIGFLIFALLIVAEMHFNVGQYVPTSLRAWYFEMAIGLPVILLALALCFSLLRREQIDWWTTITAPLIICVWCVGIVLKAAAT